MKEFEWIEEIDVKPHFYTYRGEYITVGTKIRDNVNQTPPYREYEVILINNEDNYIRFERLDDYDIVAGSIDMLMDQMSRNEFIII